MTLTSEQYIENEILAKQRNLALNQLNHHQLTFTTKNKNQKRLKSSPSFHGLDLRQSAKLIRISNESNEIKTINKLNKRSDQNHDKRQQQKRRQRYVYLVVGETGSGKSTFINHVYNYFHGERDFDKILNESASSIKLAIPVDGWLENLDEKYRRSQQIEFRDSTKSQTNECESYEMVVVAGENENENEIKFEFIDTPGFNTTDFDSSYTTSSKSSTIDKDELIFNNISDYLLKYSEINGIVLVLNGSLPRLDLGMRNLINNLMNLSSNQACKSLVIVLTNTDVASCNFHLAKLDLFSKQIEEKEPSIFYMQNSLLKLRRPQQQQQQQQNDAKYLRRLRMDWSNTMETIEELCKCLVQLEPFQTSYLKENKEKKERILKSIQRSISLLKKLCKKRNEIEIRKAALEKSRLELSANENHYDDYVLKAVPFVNESTVATTSKIANTTTKNSTPLHLHRSIYSRVKKFFSVLFKKFIKKPFELLSEFIALNFCDFDDYYVVDDDESEVINQQQQQQLSQKKKTQQTIDLNVKLRNEKKTHFHSKATNEIQSLTQAIEKCQSSMNDSQRTIEETLEKIAAEIKSLRSISSGLNLMKHFYPMLINSNSSKEDNLLIIKNNNNGDTGQHLYYSRLVDLFNS